MTDKDIEKVEPVTARSEEIPKDDRLEIGTWYWVASDREEGGRWLGCIVHVGTNYAKLEGVEWTRRVHFDEFHKVCTLEAAPDAYIDERIHEHQGEVQRLLGRVKELTARLGVAPSPELAAGGETMALAKVEAGRDFKSYSKDLVKAKKETLPDLFKQIESENKAMAEWMKAKVIPFRAQANGLDAIVEKIEDRIFSVELYAGLTEEVELIRDGEPAPLGTKVHLLQRRHYMDEECLVDYKTGGMEFRNIGQFDRWVCKKAQLARLLPFPRCVLAFQVRRERKDREVVDLSDFIKVMELEKLDKATFLYIRNGERVYRLSTSLDFGQKLFPDFDKSKLDAGRLWAKMRSGVEAIITDNEHKGLWEDYERELKEWKAQEKAYKAALKTPEAMARAEKQGKKKPDASCVDVPWPGFGPHPPDSWAKYVPYSPESVYYDDITAKIDGEIKHHNRIALVLQGLLDRSPVFHPHPPWQIWSNDGFRAALELVYDEDRALPAGEKPDFEAFRERLNESLADGCVTVGQENLWELAEGAKESERLANDWRYHGKWYPDRFRPSGNPGPGHLAKVFKFSKKGQKCTYAWNRERQTNIGGSYGDPIRTTFTCGTGGILNVDAYKPGDYKVFFNDPRTRSEYLKWAPMLLEAEEYHAGNREVADPVPPEPAKAPSWEGRRRYAQRKLRKQLMRKAVRLTRDVKMRSGRVYAKGTLWRVSGGSGSEFSVFGINPDGTYEGGTYETGGDRAIDGLVSQDFEVDDSIPDPKEEGKGDEAPDSED